MTVEKETKTCVICGKEFTPTSSMQKICGSTECKKERRRRYSRTHAYKYREVSKAYKKQAHVKVRLAEYDKKYQEEHKEQIRAYKRLYFQKKQFFKYLSKGKVLQNAYWYSLSDYERREVLDKISI